MMLITKMLAASILSLVSTSLLAVPPGETIRVFFNDKAPVKLDISLPDHIRVIGYNMDTSAKADSEITALIQARIAGEVTPHTAQQRYADEFVSLMNSDDYPHYYNKIKRGALNTGNALRFQIKKLPAIIFNESQVIYGVTSLAEAIRLYGENRIEK